MEQAIIWISEKIKCIFQEKSYFENLRLEYLKRIFEKIRREEREETLGRFLKKIDVKDSDNILLS